MIIDINHAGTDIKKFEVEVEDDLPHPLQMREAFNYARENGMGLNGIGWQDVDLSGHDLSGIELVDCEFEAANFHEANLSGAVMYTTCFFTCYMNKANLVGTDLDKTHFYKCDLTDALLGGTSLNDSIFEEVVAYGRMFSRPPIQLEVGYRVTIWDDFMVIGCEKHSLYDWEKFTGEEIVRMGGRKGLAWWKEWKSALLNLAGIRQKVDKPTGFTHAFFEGIDELDSQKNSRVN